MNQSIISGKIISVSALQRTASGKPILNMVLEARREYIRQGETCIELTPVSLSFFSSTATEWHGRLAVGDCVVVTGRIGSPSRPGRSPVFHECRNYIVVFDVLRLPAGADLDEPQDSQEADDFAEGVSVQ